MRIRLAVVAIILVAALASFVEGALAQADPRHAAVEAVTANVVVRCGEAHFSFGKMPFAQARALVGFVEGGLSADALLAIWDDAPAKALDALMAVVNACLVET